MKAYDNGAFYTVAVSAREVEAFASRWPCCTLPRRAISFQFDKRNGDLVDIGPARIAHRIDGPEALALAEDAQAYGRKRLGLAA